MAVTRDLFFNFIGDSKRLEAASARSEGALDKVQSRVDRVADRMSKFGKGLTAGVTLPIIGAFALGARSLAENEALLAQTNAVIDSTGAAAGVTADEVLGLANEISNYSGVAHESIVEGQNMLLTFTNVRNEVGEGNDVFNQATKVLTDMSVATGKDMASASIQLGKALNDPIKGVSALAEAGVQFTDEQRDLIETLVESGDVMGAQKIILAELETQFGGSAAAAGQTMQGSLNRLKNSFEEATRSLATLLIPVLQTLTSVLQTVLNWFNNLSPGAQRVITVLAGVAAAVGPVLIVGANLVRSFETIQGAFTKVSKALSINPYVALIAATAAIVVLIIANWDKISAFLSRVWGAIRNTASAVWNGIKSTIAGVLNALVTLFINFPGVRLLAQHWDNIKAAVQGVKDFIVERFNQVVDFFRGLGARIGEAFRFLGDVLRAPINGLLSALESGINFALRGLQRAVDTADVIAGPFINFPDNLFSPVSIPRLHEGGIFRAPRPGGEGLAVLEDGERVLREGAVVPATEQRPTVVQLIVDGQTLAEALIRHEEALA